MSSEKFANISIPRTGVDYFTYRVPEHLQNKVKPGKVAIVPFLKTKAKGVIVSLTNETEVKKEKIKNIEEVLDEEFSTTEPYLELAKWMKDYYLTSFSDVVTLLFAPGIVERGTYYYRLSTKKLDQPDNPIVEYLQRIYPRGATIKTLSKLFGTGVNKKLQELTQNGIVTLHDKIRIKSFREINLFTPIDVLIPTTPTPSQKELLEKFFKELPPVSLIHGVTGSGKTRVYSWIVEKFIKEGKSALILVPEIALTPQIYNYFYHIFKNDVIFYHSKLSDSERRWVFKQVREGRKRIVIGPRSSLFLPIKDLGIIVIDEEHDQSYKETEKMPSYHARDVAIRLGGILKIPIILGSASPSVESYYNAKVGAYALLELRERVPHYKPPTIKIVDMRKIRGDYPFSIDLINEINSTIKQDKQIILFINRRGYSTVYLCLDCGHVFQCNHCSVNLVFHKTDKKLHCHMCGTSYDPPSTCPNCHSLKLTLKGSGTQKIEEAVEKYFKNLEVKRVDLDSFIKEGVSQEAFKNFYQGKLKVLVGTKMVGKGFDFPNLGLIGIVNADIGLGLPDFRSEERVFQLLLQAAGRIRTGGKVIVQTYNPNSRAIKFLKEFDYEGFAESELQEREKFNYPPFSYITLIEFSGKQLEKLTDFAKNVKQLILSRDFKSLEVLGPVPSPISRKGGNYLVRLILKYKDRYLPFKLDFLREIKIPYNITITIDVDPQELI